MTEYAGIHHLAFATRDLDQTIRFWRDLLGMRLLAKYGRPGYLQYFFEITPHDMIAFFEWPDVEPIRGKDHGTPVKGPFAFDHVALEVADDDALWRLKDSLDAAGVWVSEVVDHGFIHSIYTFDPNNIPLEFSTPVVEVDIREYPVEKDIEQSSVAAEGVAPQPGHWPLVKQPTPENERRVYPGEGLFTSLSFIILLQYANNN